MAAGGSAAREQVQEFLRFFASKRELYMAEVEGVFQDVRDARLTDSMYTLADVQSILSDAVFAVKESTKKELEKESAMAALVLEQVFTAAVASDVPLAIDLAKTEDEAALAEVGRMKLLDLSETDLKKKVGAVKLDSIRDEHTRLLQSSRRLEDENAEYARRVAALESQVTGLQREKGELTRRCESLSSDVERLRRSADASSASAAAATAETVAEVARLRERVAELTTSLEDTRSELADTTVRAERAEAAAAADGGGGGGGGAGGSGAVGVTQTRQFQQMKLMLNRKNQQVIDLRARLSKYEPDDAKDIDEAGETPLKPRED